MMNKFYFVVITLVMLVNPALAQESQPIPGQVIVRLQPKATPELVLRQLLAKRSSAFAISAMQPLGTLHNIYILTFHPYEVDANAVLKQLQEMPEVIAAQFNYEVQIRQTPNDPDYEKQWGLERMAAPEAWNNTTGGFTAQGDTIVVALLDFGFDVNHEDLQRNIWKNNFEVPGDAVDNDNNGYIDDFVGWNFVNNSNQHFQDSHGTSVAGIIGADGNNDLGVSGINWNIKLMPFTVRDVSHIIAAYEYVIEQRKRYNETQGAQGAFVVATNLSLGIDNVFCNEQPVWGSMYDLLGEVGILTGAGTANRSYNVDQVGDMPTTCTSNFLLTCLNTTPADQIYSGSAFGAMSIDVGAPGEGSYTTKVGNRYGSFNDNSAAAPHLTGVIALLYSFSCKALTANALTQPAETALSIRQAVLNGVDLLDNLKNKTATGGRLNVFRSMETLQSYCEISTGKLALIKLYPNPVDTEITIEYETPDFENYELRIYNALGQLVHRNNITPPRFSEKVHSVDVRNWSPGMYFLTLEQGNDQVQMKFIVH